jgi:hypothetical protein
VAGVSRGARKRRGGRRWGVRGIEKDAVYSSLIGLVQQQGLVQSSSGADSRATVAETVAKNPFKSARTALQVMPRDDDDDDDDELIIIII